MPRKPIGQYPDVKWSKQNFAITIRLLEIVKERALPGGWPNFSMTTQEGRELAWALFGNRPVYRDAFKRDKEAAMTCYGGRIIRRCEQIVGQYYGDGVSGTPWRSKPWPERVVELLDELMGKDYRILTIVLISTDISSGDLRVQPGQLTPDDESDAQPEDDDQSDAQPAFMNESGSGPTIKAEPLEHATQDQMHGSVSGPTIKAEPSEHATQVLMHGSQSKPTIKIEDDSDSGGIVAGELSNTRHKRPTSSNTTEPAAFDPTLFDSGLFDRSLYDPSVLDPARFDPDQTKSLLFNAALPDRTISKPTNATMTPVLAVKGQKKTGAARGPSAQRSSKDMIPKMSFPGEKRRRDESDDDLEQGSPTADAGGQSLTQRPPKKVKGFRHRQSSDS
ncbi:MAG: hypothetical protein Q9208_002182 [Pyrenodesmia sp. 3 TL-2023]